MSSRALSRASSPASFLSKRPSMSLAQEMSSVATVVAVKTGEGPSGVETAVADALEGASVGLEVLQSLLEAVDSLPFVKYIAGIGVQIIQVALDAQDNQNAFRVLAMRAGDIILAVARSCEGMQDMATQLEKDLAQLTRTMKDIHTFAKEKIARRRYLQIWYKGQDGEAIQALQTQLDHAFQVFEVQSSISSRHLQHQMARQISTLSITPPLPMPSPVIVVPIDPDTPLLVPEGIYLIRNAVDGRVLEVENAKQPDAVHVFLAHSREGSLKTQLWHVLRKAKEQSYIIRSLATGSGLDVWQNSSYSGAHVVAHELHGGGNQTWVFHGSRPGSSAGDYCTIRSAGPQTALDARCPISRDYCDSLHVTTLPLQDPYPSQEWSLIQFTLTPSPRPALSAPSERPPKNPPAEATDRRAFRLQNVSSGLFATYATDRFDGPNVVLQPNPSPAGEWIFVYTTHFGTPQDPTVDMFAIVAASSGTSGAIDHRSSRYVTVAKFWPNTVERSWIVTPRDGAFVFKNGSSGRLLCAKESISVDTMDPGASSNPACHWRLVDAVSGEVVRVLYDSALSAMTAELSRSPPRVSPGLPPPPPGQMLRTAYAPESMQLNLARTLGAEREMPRSLLQGGYSAVVVMPQTLVGWREGRVVALKVSDEDAELSGRGRERYRSLDVCTL